jgi:outer membrane lipoprotein SlyB
MEAVKKSLHPLITAAAISVSVFSAVGVAALTGVLPHSRGTEAPSAPPALHEAAIENAVAMPAAAPLPQAAPEPAAPPAAKPKPRPKHVSRAVPPRRAPAAQTQVAQAPAAVEAPKPVPVPGVTGVVESVKEVEQKGETTPLGPIAGGVAGAVLGHQVGSGNTNKVLTVLGAGAGILAGKAVEQKARATKHWEVTVHLDNGATQTVKSEAEPGWHAGDRVRLLDGKLQPA